MSFEMNKILGALLGAMILAMLTGFIAKAIVSPGELSKPVYMVAGVKENAATSTAAAPAGPEPIGPLLASAKAANGKDITGRLCIACHTFAKGDPNRIGPNLFGVFDQPIAEGHGGYPFSSALQGHDKQKWTPELLNHWLTSPQDFAHGTKMTFAGLPKAKDRADVIAYLDSLSDRPEPLTQFETKAAAPAKPTPQPAAAKSVPGAAAEKKPAGPGTVPPAPTPAATGTAAKASVPTPATGAGAVSQPAAAPPKPTPAANANQPVGNAPGTTAPKPAPGLAIHPATPAPTKAEPSGTQPTNGQ